MSTDVGTTPRKALTPTQRLALFEAFKGVCQLCHRQIRGPDWIDEHLRALGLGGTNKWDNRAPAHIACAEAKTRNEDMPRINKAKRQKKAALGITGPKKKIESRGFAKTEKRPREVSKKLPQRRDVFTREVIEEGNCG